MRVYKHCMQLVDHAQMYNLLGNAIIHFIKLKPQPFGGALVCQVDFWKSPKWKRALVFVFLVRHVLEFPSQKIWNTFDLADYKINVRSFKRWMKLDETIMRRCTKYNALPATADPSKRKKRKAKPRPSSYSSESPMRRRCQLADSTTEEEDD